MAMMMFITGNRNIQCYVTQDVTITNVSPRPRTVLPAETVRALTDAKERAEQAHDELKRVVRGALEVGSVRQVAALLGMSPTTIQNWSKQN